MFIIKNSIGTGRDFELRVVSKPFLKLGFPLAIIALLFFLLTCIFASSVEGVEQEAKNRVLFIKGGSLYTMTKGVIHGGCILVKDGKIQKVGKNLVPPKDAFILDAENKWILPGFVVSHCSPIGLRPLVKNDRNPRLRDYLDPYNIEIEWCLSAGLTALNPNPGLVGTWTRNKKNYSFNNAVIKPIYGCLEEMLVKEPAYLYIHMLGLAPSEKEELRGYFQRAREFISKEMEYERNKELKKSKAPKIPPDLKLYVSILKKKLPVRFSAEKKKDILKVLNFVDEFGVQAHIFGAEEGWMLAKEIGERNISTILKPENFIAPDPYQYPSNGSNIKNASIQKRNGIRLAVTTTDDYAYHIYGGSLGTNLLTFPLAGSFAMRGGLDQADALKALTLWPAEILGISHRVGSLQEGKDADIIILDGNPLDYRTYVEYTIINGRILYDKNKSPLYKKIPKPKRVF